MSLANHEDARRGRDIPLKQFHQRLDSQPEWTSVGGQVT